MPVATRKMTDLKEEILAKIDEKFNEIKIDFLLEIKEQIKNEVAAAINNEIKKREEIEIHIYNVPTTCQGISEADK